MIRTRFAPSPTGYLHVGGLRTALYSYLFAKKNGGQFLLRIEDTDQERYIEGAIVGLIDTLNAMGITYDEGPLSDGTEKGEKGPYTQSLRTDLYRKHAVELIEKGHAYRCFCSKERLEEMRENQMKNKQAPMYDRQCLKLTKEEIEANLNKGEKFVIRQKIPRISIKFKDLVRGQMEFNGATVDDQVLIKSDNFPTYHLANVVDDHFMEITHVIRGEEWLPSTPKHIALYEAFGWTPPQFAHLPLLLNADKSKLSKRQGDVAVEDYLKKGYLKEAIINFVAFLGWNPGGGETREIFTLKELCDIFSLDKVHKAGAVFNLEKLDWFNWQWQKEIYNKKLTNFAQELENTVEITSDNKGQQHYKFQNPENEKKFITFRGEQLVEICSAVLPEKLQDNKEKLYKALITIEEKVLKAPKETAQNIEFYFTQPAYNKELLTHEKMGVDLKQALESVKRAFTDLSEVNTWTLLEIQNALTKSVTTLEVKNGQVFWPVRAALSGLDFSPGVFEIAWALGKEETLNRLKLTIEKF